MHSFFDTGEMNLWAYVALFTTAAFFIAGLTFAIVVRFGFERREYQEWNALDVDQPGLMVFDQLVNPPTSPIDLPPMLDASNHSTTQEIEQ